jgi:hypothetical protein
MRRKRWAAPNNPTVQAKQIWRYVYGEPWPKGWRVQWAASLPRRRIGQCNHIRKLLQLHYRAHVNPHYQEVGVVRTIYLGGPGHEIDAFTWQRRSYTASVIDTLIHEFTHARNPRRDGRVVLPHGAEFERLVTWGMNRLGLPRHYV